MASSNTVLERLVKVWEVVFIPFPFDFYKGLRGGRRIKVRVSERVLVVLALASACFARLAETKGNRIGYLGSLVKPQKKLELESSWCIRGEEGEGAGAVVVSGAGEVGVDISWKPIASTSLTRIWVALKNCSL